MHLCLYALRYIYFYYPRDAKVVMAATFALGAVIASMYLTLLRREVYFFCIQLNRPGFWALQPGSWQPGQQRVVKWVMTPSLRSFFWIEKWVGGSLFIFLKKLIFHFNFLVDLVLREKKSEIFLMSWIIHQWWKAHFHSLIIERGDASALEKGIECESGVLCMLNVEAREWRRWETAW